MKHFIFGYGSLIERESRMRTHKWAETAFPVLLNGYVRGWWARTGVAGLSTTFLGCLNASLVGDKSMGVNGVVYPIDEVHLTTMDDREKDYKRERIPIELIEDFTGKLGAKNTVWAYLNDFADLETARSQSPSKNFPIVQSYVDICINGCLEIENEFPEAKKSDFCAHFIRSTLDWNPWWVNDRIYPRRPFIYRPNAYEIDALLREHLADPGLMDKIYLE